MEQIRADFITHLESIGLNVEMTPDSLHAFSLMRCACNLLGTFEEPENNRGSWAPQGFVGAIDPHYVEGQSYCNMQYRGFMRVEIDSLYELFARQLIHFAMHEVCPLMYMRPRVIDPTKIPLYTGL